MTPSASQTKLKTSAGKQPKRPACPALQWEAWHMSSSFRTFVARPRYRNEHIAAAKNLSRSLRGAKKSDQRIRCTRPAPCGAQSHIERDTEPGADLVLSQQSHVQLLQRNDEHHVPAMGHRSTADRQCATTSGGSASTTCGRTAALQSDLYRLVFGICRARSGSLFAGIQLQ